MALKGVLSYPVFLLAFLTPPRGHRRALVGETDRVNCVAFSGSKRFSNFSRASPFALKHFYFYVIADLDLLLCPFAQDVFIPFLSCQ